MLRGGVGTTRRESGTLSDRYPQNGDIDATHRMGTYIFLTHYFPVQGDDLYEKDVCPLFSLLYEKDVCPLFSLLSPFFIASCPLFSSEDSPAHDKPKDIKGA